MWHNPMWMSNRSPKPQEEQVAEGLVSDFSPASCFSFHQFSISLPKVFRPQSRGLPPATWVSSSPFCTGTCSKMPLWGFCLNSKVDWRAWPGWYELQRGNLPLKMPRPGAIHVHTLLLVSVACRDTGMLRQACENTEHAHMKSCMYTQICTHIRICMLMDARAAAVASMHVCTLRYTHTSGVHTPPYAYSTLPEVARLICSTFFRICSTHDKYLLRTVMCQESCLALGEHSRQTETISLLLCTSDHKGQELVAFYGPSLSQLLNCL
jgi:hypothetical protein